MLYDRGYWLVQKDDVNIIVCITIWDDGVVCIWLMKGGNDGKAVSDWGEVVIG